VGRTRLDWLQAGQRVTGDSSGQLLLLHEWPTGWRRCPEAPVPAATVRDLRYRLNTAAPPTAADLQQIQHLEHSAQATWVNLYAASSVVPIDQYRQGEAWELLRHLWKVGSDRQHIRGLYDEQGREVRTVSGFLDLRRHRQGLAHEGVRQGWATRHLLLDIDRHGGAVEATWHCERVLSILTYLQSYHADLAPHIANLNPGNGSCHVGLVLPELWRLEQVQEWVGDLRRNCPGLAGVEIYPDNLQAVFLPLFPTRPAIIDQLLVPKIPAYRFAGQGEDRHKVDYLAHDAVAYWTWLTNPNRSPCNLTVVEQELLAACSNCPDSPPLRKTRLSTFDQSAASGMGNMPRLEGRCAQVIVDFLTGKLQAEPDSLGKYLVVALRMAWAQGESKEEAVTAILGFLNDLPHKSFSDRLSGNNGGLPELERVVNNTATAIWQNNGYQSDPEGSTEKLEHAADAWQQSGFRVLDPSTWHRAKGKHEPAPAREIVWTPFMLSLLPTIMLTAHCSRQQAEDLLRLVCANVEQYHELSLTYLGRLLEMVGIANYANHQVAIRRMLVEVGILMPVRRGFRDPGEETGIGNHYICGLIIEFAAVATPGLRLHQSDPDHSTPESNYPSFHSAPTTDQVLRDRRKRAEQHWQERVKWYRGDLRLTG